MGPFKMQELYGITRKDAMVIDAAAREAYPNIVRWWGEIRRKLEADGKLVNPWGLPSWYYNSYAKAAKYAKEADFRESVGWIVQSTEAMMCLTVLPKLEKLWPLYSRLVTTTHDSFLLSTSPVEQAELAPLVGEVREVLERGWEELQPSSTHMIRTGVRVFWAKADLKVGRNWRDLSPL
jgi:hypothetical protein